MYLEDAIEKLILLKYFELKAKIPGLTMENLVLYLKNVVFRKITPKNLNETAYYIMNIKINMVIEYLNVEALLDKTHSIADDFDDIMKG